MSGYESSEVLDDRWKIQDQREGSPTTNARWSVLPPGRFRDDCGEIIVAILLLKRPGHGRD
jgi:hypothetical protein